MTSPYGWFSLQFLDVFGELRSFKLATFLRKGLSGFCGKGNRELSSASKKKEHTMLAGGKQFLKGIPGLLFFCFLIISINGSLSLVVRGKSPNCYSPNRVTTNWNLPSIAHTPNEKIQIGNLKTWNSRKGVASPGGFKNL